MSIKEDVEYIKKEIDTEEKFLSGIAHAERFWKKYKKPLIGVSASFIAGIALYFGYSAYADYQINTANEALSRLLANPSDKDALDILKQKDAKLYDVYTMQVAAKAGNIQALKDLSNSSAQFVGELSTYQAAALDKNSTKLLEIGDDKTKIMKDLALMDSGVIALQKKDNKAAQSAFAKVPQNSQSKPEASTLEHFSQTTK